MANHYLEFGTPINGQMVVLNNAAFNFGLGSFSICYWGQNVYGQAGTIYSYIGGMVSINSTTGGDNNPDLELSSGMDVTIDSVNLDQSPTWHHYAFVVDRVANTGLGYTDAQPNNPPVSIVGLGTLTDLTGSLVVGALENNMPLDDLRIYKGIALSQTQINTIFNNGFGKKYDVADAGAGLAFNFDDNSNPTQTVSTGTATLTGTLGGGVTYQSGGVPFSNPFGVNTGGVMSLAPALNENWSW